MCFSIFQDPRTIANVRRRLCKPYLPKRQLCACKLPPSDLESGRLMSQDRKASMELFSSLSFNICNSTICLGERVGGGGGGGSSS